MMQMDVETIRPPPLDFEVKQLDPKGIGTQKQLIPGFKLSQSPSDFCVEGLS